eukprot:TRINITY_DN2424_c0_g1_i1.p1 TRINITY_DN2424_c0_g1~~TRINITY_DN2424_c0_g1_i1.p1  ORF type:complete len:300 (+),score=60.25 TRINITY_DN2424_c0_g1_i1:103-1002(+)
MSSCVDPNSLAAAADGKEAELTISLPQSVYDNLAKLAGADTSLEDAVASLVKEADRRRRLSSLGGQVSPNCFAAQTVGPEIHGGPEGVYERDHSTGRWRSASRVAAPRKEKEAPVRKQELLERATGQASDEIQASADDMMRHDAIPEDLAAAQEAIKKVQAENPKLWEAAASMLPANLAGTLRASWELSQAQAHVELEKDMQAKAWEAIRANCDVTTLALISRKATGCEGERALSVGAARNIFEAPPPSERRECMGRRRSRPHVSKADASRPENVSKVRQESPSARYLSFLRQSTKGGA